MPQCHVHVIMPDVKLATKHWKIAYNLLKFKDDETRSTTLQSMLDATVVCVSMVFVFEETGTSWKNPLVRLSDHLTISQAN